MRKRKILVAFGLLACMAAGTVFHGMTGFVHAEESTLEMVNLADGVTYGCNEQGMPQFVNLNGNSVIIKDVPAEEGGTVKYHNIYIDKNRNGIVDDGEEKVVLDKDMGGSDNSDVPAGIPIYGVYQAKSTTPIRITLEGNGYGTVIGVNRGELVTSEGTAVFMDIDCGSIGECYAAKSSTVTVSGTVEKAIAVRMVNGNISALYGVQDCTVIAGENVNTGIALEMTGGSVGGCYADKASDIAMSDNSKKAVDIDILQDAVVIGCLYAVEAASGTGAGVTEVVGSIDANINTVEGKESGYNVSSCQLLNGNVVVDGAVTVTADNISANSFAIATSLVTISESLSVDMGENTSVSTFLALSSATVEKDVTINMYGKQSDYTSVGIVSGKAESCDYSVGGDLKFTNVAGNLSVNYIMLGGKVNGNVIVSILDGTVGQLYDLVEKAEVGGDFKFTTGETVVITGAIQSCHSASIEGNYELVINNANNESMANLYTLRSGKIGGDVIIVVKGGKYNYLNATSVGDSEIGGNYTIKLESLEASTLYGIYSISVAGNARVAIDSVTARYIYGCYNYKGKISGDLDVSITNSVASSCCYPVDLGTYEQNVEVVTENNMFYDFYGLYVAKVTGNVTLLCTGDSGDSLYCIEGVETQILGNAVIELTNCNYGNFYGINSSYVEKTVDIQINGGSYTKYFRPYYVSATKDSGEIMITVDGATLGTEDASWRFENQVSGDTLLTCDVKDTCTINGKYSMYNVMSHGSNGAIQIAFANDRYYSGTSLITEDVVADNLYFSNGCIVIIPEGVTMSVAEDGMIYASNGAQFLIEGTLKGAVCQESEYVYSYYLINGGTLDTSTEVFLLYYPMTLDYSEKEGTVTISGGTHSNSLWPELLFGMVGYEIPITCKAKAGYKLIGAEVKKLTDESPIGVEEDEGTAGKYSFIMPEEPINVNVTFAATPITLDKTELDMEAEFNKATTAEDPLYNIEDIEIINDAEEGTVSYEVDEEYGLPTGLRLKNGKIYGTPARVYEDGKTTIIHITGKNGTKADLTLNIVVQQGESELVKVEVPIDGLPVELAAEYGNILSEIELPYNKNGVWYLGGEEIENPTVSAEDLPDGAFVWEDADIVVDALEGEEAVYFVTYVPEDPDCYEIMPAQLQVSVKVIHIHRYGDIWKTDADKHWKECGCGEKAEEAAHTWDAGVVTQQPTATEAGERTLTCTVCEATKIVEEPATGENPHEHTYSDTWKTDADKHWKECECGEKAEEAAHIWDAGVVTKQPTATEAGERTLTCTVCGMKKVVSEPVTGEKPHEHTYLNTWKTDADKHWKECECGEKAEEAVHTWDAGVVIKQPTATEKGEKIITCTVCKKIKTEMIAALGGTIPGGNENSGGNTNIPAAGTILNDSVTKAKYKVTGTEEGSRTVMYMATTDKAAATVNIPAIVIIDNISYDVTAIADNAFKNNKKLKKVVISSKILTIGNAAFSGCKKLATVTMGANVTTIGKNAFYNCVALKKIVIPKTVVKIGSKAFYGCKKLLNITIKTTKLTTKNVGSKAFTKAGSSNYKKMVVKVPKSKLKAYKKTLKKRGVNSKAKIKK